MSRDPKQTTPSTPPDRSPLNAHLPNETSSAERARILLALIDQKNGASDELSSLANDARALRETEPAGLDGMMPSKETLLKSARDLLARLEPSRKERTPMAADTPPKPAVTSRAVVRSTVAALIESSDLTQEHPAIIALVLQNQDAKTKAAVLRQLPGPLARRVQRCMAPVRLAS